MERIICSNIESWTPSPENVQFLVGGGVSVICSNQTNRLIVELIHIQEKKIGFMQIGNCMLRYVGKDLSEVESFWLTEIAKNLERISKDKLSEWETFLHWASRLKKSYAKPTDKKLTQGNELLVRLLEPCQARCSFCICRSAQPDLVSSAEDIEERMIQGNSGWIS